MRKIKKNKGMQAFLAIVLGSAAGLAIADVESDILAEFSERSKSSATTAEQWFELAGRAREAEQIAIADQSLDQASAAGFSPIRIGMERARVRISSQDEDAAVAALRGIFEQGFTAVGFMTSDPLIATLSGNAEFDALVEKMSRQAYPCRHQDGFADFDFWLGRWDVHLANGTPAGSNVIEQQERGCVLMERWTSTTGGTGMSINYLDMATGEWVQVWNAEGGTQINIRGGLTDDGMAMEGTINYVANGATAPFRALWTPLPDGRVRQYFEQSNDGGESWVPWFEGFYTRVDE